MSKRGRPALFDCAKALESAMEMFWDRGYEGATLETLQAAMGGISPPSFYNAFGSKEALFAEVVELYVSTIAALAGCALQEGKTARDSIAAMLRKASNRPPRPANPMGACCSGAP
jgi:AcrR family transcriptional regulator